MSTSTPGLNIGAAIKALKAGSRVARPEWNGAYLWLLPAATVKAEWCREPHLKAQAEANGGEIECLGSIRMMTADHKVLTGWLASQIDILADDWTILDPIPEPQLPYQVRVQNEAAELDERIEKLRTFIFDNAGYLTLSGEERFRLKEQLEAMQRYAEILHLRIRSFV